MLSLALTNETRVVDAAPFCTPAHPHTHTHPHPPPPCPFCAVWLTFAPFGEQEKFDAFRDKINSEPVVVDLYKPLPDRYATIKVGSLAQLLFGLQRDYWTAMNANPRFVYRQELRTYMFDPDMASPERLAEDCHYWACLENESMLESQTEMALAAAENADQGDQDYWANTLAYNEGSHQEATRQSPPNTLPTNTLPTKAPLLRYETKLKLEASAWEFKKTARDVRDEHPEMGPDMPDYFVSFRTLVRGRVQMEPYMAWTFFQVGEWHRDAEFRRARFLAQKGLPMKPAEGADWDYERYTTAEAGLEEATESVHDYERRLDIEERELEPERSNEDAGAASDNLHRRCPEHDLANYDVSFSGREPKIDEFAGTKENRPLTHAEFWEMQKGVPAVPQGAAEAGGRDVQRRGRADRRPRERLGGGGGGRTGRAGGAAGRDGERRPARRDVRRRGPRGDRARRGAQAADERAQDVPRPGQAAPGAAGQCGRVGGVQEARSGTAVRPGGAEGVRGGEPAGDAADAATQADPR